MKLYLACLMSVTAVALSAQSVTFSRIGEKTIRGKINNVYRVQVYNNTNHPICIPVSLAFGYTANDQDTVEVVNIYPSIDSVCTFSLYYTKSDMEGSRARYPAIPVVLNPGTFLLTHIFIDNSGSKKMRLNLQYTSDDNLDFYKIWRSYQTKQRYEWTDGLKFVERMFPLE